MKYRSRFEVHSRSDADLVLINTLLTNFNRFLAFTSSRRKSEIGLNLLCTKIADFELKTPAEPIPAKLLRWISKRSSGVSKHVSENVLSRGIVGDLAGEPKVACPLYKKLFSLKSGICLNGEDYSLQIFSSALKRSEASCSLRQQSKLMRCSKPTSTASLLTVSGTSREV